MYLIKSLDLQPGVTVALFDALEIDPATKILNLNFVSSLTGVVMTNNLTDEENYGPNGYVFPVSYGDEIYIRNTTAEVVVLNIIVQQQNVE